MSGISTTGLADISNIVVALIERYVSSVIVATEVNCLRTFRSSLEMLTVKLGALIKLTWEVVNE